MRGLTWLPALSSPLAAGHSSGPRVAFRSQLASTLAEQREGYALVGVRVCNEAAAVQSQGYCVATSLIQSAPGAGPGTVSSV